MKKIVALTLVLLMLIGLTGCSNKTKYIDAQDVTESMMLARADGSLQVATVEKFDKEYYNLTELNDFIGKEIVAYNDTVKAENIKLDKVDVRDIGGSKAAVMVLSYAGMKDYADFNQALAAYFHAGVKDVTLDLPKELLSYKKQDKVNTEDVIKHSDYRVLVVTEQFHIIVGGKIKYYSENAKKIDNNEVRSAAEGKTVIVYKP